MSNGLLSQFEEFVRDKLTQDKTLDGAAIWAAYLTARVELINEVISVIGNVEPNLSDHCERHIVNVLDNIAKLIGLQDSAVQVEISTAELVAAMMAALLHDIGNIEGRKEHNRAIAAVLEKLDVTKHVWSRQDIKSIERICQAHTGVNAEGGRDTVGPLHAQRTVFLGQTIRAGHIAALLRFADELAEGPQRTSKYLLRTSKYAKESEVFHRYASVTKLAIDFQGKVIIVEYYIDIKEKTLGSTSRLQKQNLTELVGFIFHRASKLEAERRYNRHHAPELILFKEIAISFHFSKGLIECDARIEPITLNDITSHNDLDGQPFKVFKSIDIKKTVDALLKEQ